MKTYYRLLHYLTILSLTLALAALPLSAARAQSAPSDTYCRFGIGVAGGLTGYDLSQLGVGTYLDWGSWRFPGVPDNIRFIYVLRVSDDAYTQTLADLPGRLDAFKGASWIIGNEPDAEVTYQDHVTAQVYAERYFALASTIRTHDSTAQIGFGPVIQPTPLRLHYLNLALQRLDQHTGSRSATLNLIDVFTIHNFILNEEPIYKNGVAVSWGAGVPPGYDPATWPAPEVIMIAWDNNETWKTHDIGIFQQRIVNFRQWMKDIGAQNKPLWISEYGSLFPSVGNEYLKVTDEQTADFLEASFDYMLSAKDNQTGYPPDGNRLVQNFVWYSLNEKRTTFGGSLYDPDTRLLTPVGERFISYDPPAGALPAQLTDLYLLQNSLRVYPVWRSGAVEYRFVFRASNAIASEYRTPVEVELFLNNNSLGVQQAILPRCSGRGTFTFTTTHLSPGTAASLRAEIRLRPGTNGPESNAGNDSYTFPSLTLPDLYTQFFPIIGR